MQVFRKGMSINNLYDLLNFKKGNEPFNIEKKIVLDIDTVLKKQL